MAPSEQEPNWSIVTGGEFGGTWLDHTKLKQETGITFVKLSWCGLRWSEWIPFDEFSQKKAALPAEPGIYRIRPVDGDYLMYIGQTGRTLRQRLSELSKYRKTSELMPYNDPHTAAPSLWAWRDATGLDFECSGTPLPITTNTRAREVIECYLLWQYRLEYGSSTLCNFGRFHPNYRKSKDRSSRQRGGRLPEGITNPAGGASLPPLWPVGSPCSADWMALQWNEFQALHRAPDIPRRPGLYRIMSIEDDDVIYIGQSANLRARLSTHAQKEWGVTGVAYSYVACSPDILPHQLKEWENDLIAGYYAKEKRAPIHQFTGR